MSLIRRLSPLSFVFICAQALADGKIEASFGYFSINAKTSDASTSIANPSAFRIGYLKPVSRKVELNFSYSMVLADFSGSDLGYGVDLGANYYYLTSTSDDSFKDDQIEVKRYEVWRPYLGATFSQRNFQSVKNSYAGFGVAAGIERYWDDRLNLKAEIRSIALSGSNDSTASESSVLLGVVFKL